VKLLEDFPVPFLIRIRSRFEDVWASYNLVYAIAVKVDDCRALDAYIIADEVTAFLRPRGNRRVGWNIIVDQNSSPL